MDNITTLIVALVAAFAGNGLIQFLINRRDTRKDKTAEIAESVESLKKMVCRHKAETVRRYILDFADQTRLGRERSQESWTEMLDLCEWYEHYCTVKDPEFRNGKTVQSVKQIRASYDVLFPLIKEEEHENL